MILLGARGAWRRPDTLASCGGLGAASAEVGVSWGDHRFLDIDGIMVGQLCAFRLYR